jgi:acyl-CoA synthetase (AMP-forming)/AMP-acid ligase II
MPPIHWASLQATLVQRFGPRIAVVDAAGGITYAGLFAHAAGIGQALLAAGVRPGELVATFLRNGRDAVAAAYATQLAGACETPLNIAYTEQERAETLAIAGCRQVICAAEHAGFFRAQGCVVHVAEAIAPAVLDPAAFPAVDPALPGRIGFTSGTTGLPKAIVYRQATRFLANVVLQASLPWLPKAGERVLLMTPFAHGAALQTFAWLDQGGEVVLLDGVRIERVEALLAEGSIAALFAAPTVLAKLAASFSGRAFPGVRTVFTGTAPLPPSVYAAARAMFGPAMRLTYGKTEVFNPITVLTPEETEQYYAEGPTDDGSCCVGWPGPGVQLAIAEDGEILIRAAHMSDGTLVDGEIRPWRADGFHPTGDIGRIDDQGRLHLLARISDAMKSGGYKIYPQEIERALGPDITVLGLPSEYWGEIVVAVAENPAPGWEDAARAAVAGLAPYKRPRFHFAVEAVPRNGQGKIVRRALLARLQTEWRLADGPRPTLERLS